MFKIYVLICGSGSLFLLHLLKRFLCPLACMYIHIWAKWLLRFLELDLGKDDIDFSRFEGIFCGVGGASM